MKKFALLVSLLALPLFSSAQTSTAASPWKHWEKTYNVLDNASYNEAYIAFNPALQNFYIDCSTNEAIPTEEFFIGLDSGSGLSGDFQPMFLDRGTTTPNGKKGITYSFDGDVCVAGTTQHLTISLSIEKDKKVKQYHTVASILITNTATPPVTLAQRSYDVQMTKMKPQP